MEKNSPAYLSREGDKNSIGGNYIYKLTHDREGNIWVAADGSLNKINKKSECDYRLHLGSVQ